MNVWHVGLQIYKGWYFEICFNISLCNLIFFFCLNVFLNHLWCTLYIDITFYLMFDLHKRMCILGKNEPSSQAYACVSWKAVWFMWHIFCIYVYAHSVFSEDYNLAKIYLYLTTYIYHFLSILMLFRVTGGKGQVYLEQAASLSQCWKYIHACSKQWKNMVIV